MDYKIVADSSCDLNDIIKEDLSIELVPFTIAVDEENFSDDQDLVMEELVNAMKKSPIL